MKNFHNFKFEIHTQQRILLFLIATLAVCTLLLTFVVSDIKKQVVLDRILGKETSTKPTTTTTTKTNTSTSILPTTIKSTGTTAVITSTKPASSIFPTSPIRLTISPRPSGVIISPPRVSLTPVPFIGGAIAQSPPCPASAHSTTRFHTLYNSVLGCHYDHEHGENPFTPAVAAAFPGLNLQSLLGGVQIAHTNHSGPMENTHKHGGFKWQVQTTTPNGCALGFEGATVAINAIATQYHAFGNYAIEFDSRIHSAMALMRQCLPGSTDYGYVYTVQHVDYGQRVSGYQGDIIPYPDSPNPPYLDGLAPYLTIDCIGRSAPPCGRYTTYEQYKAANGNTSSTWTTKSPRRISPSGSPLFMLLFRARDTYQILDWRDTVHPFKFLWMCSDDGGATYSSRPGCRYNNTTTRVHEVAGTIPAAWDNLAGFDTNPRVGRITANGYTTRFGTRNPNCTAPGVDCHPIRLVNTYVGNYGSSLAASGKGGFNLIDLPERDIYFCNGRVCTETSPGAVASGWIGPNN